MAKKIHITRDQLLELLRYEPETGKLFHKKRGEHWFKSDGHRSAEARAKAWNTALADKEVVRKADGYIAVGLFNKKYRAHRIIWVMVHGVEPITIDHINGDRSDNRLVNLRSVNHQTNLRNTKRSKANTSGATGVKWRGNTQKWQAIIRNGNKQVSLGYFEDMREAIAARKKAEAELGYHPNHGRG
jgi:hypothetical protein